jgi:hypothetical protein
VLAGGEITVHYPVLKTLKLGAPTAFRISDTPGAGGGGAGGHAYAVLPGESVHSPNARRRVEGGNAVLKQNATKCIVQI